MLGIEEYVKRLTSYIKFEIVEVPDERAPTKLTDQALLALKEREAERIVSQLKQHSHVIALAVEGVLWSSEQLAAQMKHLSTYGTNHIVFVIGGSYGLSTKIIQRAKQCISFGRITIPHQIMRLLLVEQIYRSVTINIGTKYHK